MTVVRGRIGAEISTRWGLSTTVSANISEPSYWKTAVVSLPVPPAPVLPPVSDVPPAPVLPPVSDVPPAPVPGVPPPVPVLLPPAAAGDPSVSHARFAPNSNTVATRHQRMRRLSAGARVRATVSEWPPAIKAVSICRRASCPGRLAVRRHGARGRRERRRGRRHAALL